MRPHPFSDRRFGLVVGALEGVLSARRMAGRDIPWVALSGQEKASAHSPAEPLAHRCKAAT